MLDQILKKLKKLNISKSSRILLALSGGIDSMVLMDLLKKGNELALLNEILIVKSLL